MHALDHHRGLDEIAAVLGEEPPAARLAHLVAGPPDALEPPAHRAGRLDLDDEIDRAHVDAQLERAGGHEALQVAALQAVLDLEAALPAQRPVVGQDELVAVGDRRPPCGLRGPVLAVDGQLVEPGGEALGQPPAVDEHDGGPVLLDELEQAGVHGRPDASPHGTGGHRPAHRLFDHLAEGAHVLDGDHHLDVKGLAHPGIDDGHRTGAGRLARCRLDLAAEEACDLVERALGGGQADALERALGVGLEALERERQVGTLLAGRQGVDSSMITDSTERSVSAPCEVSIR